MRKHILHTLFLIALASCISMAQAETIDVRLRIRQTEPEAPKTIPREITITRDNLIEIQQFIIKQGKRATYSNMYNNNPTHETKNYYFYLNPDKVANINCDLKKSGFHNLTIQKSKAKDNQYRRVEFLDKHYVYITASWPTGDLSVQQIRQFVVDAMQEILAEIKKKIA